MCQKEYWCINGEGWHCHSRGISSACGNSKGARKYLIYESRPHVRASIKNFIKIFYMNYVHCVRRAKF